MDKDYNMKFRYGDVVEVVNTFYKGQKGIVVRVQPIKSLFGNILTYEYRIELVDDSLNVYEDDLKLLKRETEEENNGSH